MCIPHWSGTSALCICKVQTEEELNNKIYYCCIWSFSGSCALSTNRYPNIWQSKLTYWNSTQQIACPMYESMGFNCHFDRNFMGNLLTTLYLPNLCKSLLQESKTFDIKTLFARRKIHFCWFVYICRPCGGCTV